MLNLFWDEDHFAMSPKMKTKEKALGDFNMQLLKLHSYLVLRTLVLSPLITPS
jgi:hypothetical protein